MISFNSIFILNFHTFIGSWAQFEELHGPFVNLGVHLPQNIILPRFYWCLFHYVTQKITTPHIIMTCPLCYLSTSTLVPAQPLLQFQRSHYVSTPGFRVHNINAMLKSKRPPHLLPPPLHHSLFHYVASIPFPPTSPLLDHVFYKLQSNFLFIQTQKQFSIFNFYLFGFPHTHSAF